MGLFKRKPKRAVVDNRYRMRKSPGGTSEFEGRWHGVHMKVKSDPTTVLDLWHLLANNEPTGDEVMNFLIQGASAGILTYTITKE